MLCYWSPPSLQNPKKWTVGVFATFILLIHSLIHSHYNILNSLFLSLSFRFSFSVIQQNKERTLPRLGCRSIRFSIHHHHHVHSLLLFASNLLHGLVLFKLLVD